MVVIVIAGRTVVVNTVDVVTSVLVYKYSVVVVGGDVVTCPVSGLAEMNLSKLCLSIRATCPETRAPRPQKSINAQGSTILSANLSLEVWHYQHLRS